MKEGWELKTLGDVATFINGDRSTKYPSKKDYVVDGIPFVNAGNLSKAGLALASLNFISQSKYDSLTQGKFVEGDILFCLRGTLGKHSIVQNGLKGAIASSLVIIRTKNGFCNKYISYYLDYKQPFIERLNNGAAQPNIPAKTMKGFSILLPSNEKQQQSIVDYLDSAFAKIDAMKANAEKALNEAKALFQASLKEMLEPKEGIKWGTIGELFETYSGGTPTKSNKEYYEDGTIPWLRSGEVCQKEIKETEMFITEKGLKESSAKYYPENTVVVAMYGATAAQVGILRIKSTSNQAVCGILPQKDFLPEFVYYWFSSIEKKLAAQAQGGAQPNISQQKIKKIEIPIYSITEQQTIVTTLDSLKSKVDCLQENFDKISQECNTLKQAILRQVFE